MANAMDASLLHCYIWSTRSSNLLDVPPKALQTAGLQQDLQNNQCFGFLFLLFEIFSTVVKVK
jgi:hypothetical protein